MDENLGRLLISRLKVRFLPRSPLSFLVLFPRRVPLRVNVLLGHGNVGVSAIRANSTRHTQTC